MKLPHEKDPMGNAIMDYQEGVKDEKLWVYSDISDRDEIPVKYLFRPFKSMPNIEKNALKACYGNVLDVGAAAGSHSLWLSEKGLNVTSIDISELSVQAMIKRKVTQAKCADFYNLPKTQKYDTLLFLMNGIGIAESIDGLAKFFATCSELLNVDGQILLDSSNIEYMFDNEDEKPESNYFGEVKYIMRYGDIVSDSFKWLFIDFDTLRIEAERYGFQCIKVFDGPHYDYLAKLTIKTKNCRNQEID